SSGSRSSDESTASGRTAVSVIAIVLGVAGVILGASSLVMLSLKTKVSIPIADPKLADLRAELERRTNEDQKALRSRALVQAPVMALVSGILAAAGIAGLRLRGWGF